MTTAVGRARPVTKLKGRLTQQISTASTSIAFVSTDSGRSATSIVMSDFGDVGFITINPQGNAANYGIAKFTGLSVSGSTITLTGVTWMTFQGDDTATGDSITWGAGTAIACTNNHSYFNHYVDLSSAQTIAGAKTFSTVPLTTGGNPAAANELARKAYVDAVAGGLATTNKLIVAATAGETVSAGQIVYFDETDKEWKLADADFVNPPNYMLGIAQGSGTDGNPITSGVLLKGLDENQSGLTDGVLYFLSNTAGGVSSSAGTYQYELGYAQGATKLYFEPAFKSLVLQTQKDALAGTSGTPSSSNKYVTDADTAATPAASKVARFKANSKLDDAGLALTTAGDLPYSDGTDLQRLALGSFGQSLKAGASAPAWGNTTLLSLATTDVTVTNTTTETSLFSFSVPANQLSTNKGVYVLLNVSAFNSTATTFTLRYKYGGTTLITYTQGGSAVGGGTSTVKGYIEFFLFGNGATNVQEGLARSVFVDETSADFTTNKLETWKTVTGTAAEDSTGALTLDITYQRAAASNSDVITVANGFAVAIN